MNKNELTQAIKHYATELGFDEIKVMKAEPIDQETQEKYKEWLRQGYNASMEYLERNIEKRFDPLLLVSGAKSIILFTLNYYPEKIQEQKFPQISYYAYGKDYHKVIKDKLKKLFSYSQSLHKNIDGRFFCDSAPILERYWATKAGIGWIGKNSLMIIPKRGSFSFISSLVLNVELQYDQVQTVSSKCGKCTRCIDACPTNAIIRPYVIDSTKCLSYQTIENKGDISPDIVPMMNNRFFGCDICQTVCPWNKFAKPNYMPEFEPLENILSITADELKNMTQERYEAIFKGSAIKRIKLYGIKRNIDALIDVKNNV